MASSITLDNINLLLLNNQTLVSLYSSSSWISKSLFSSWTLLLSLSLLSCQSHRCHHRCHRCHYRCHHRCNHRCHRCHHCCHRCCHRCHCCPHKCSPRVDIKVLVFLAPAVLVVLLNINHQIIIINIRLATWKLAHCLIKSILLKISRQIWYEIHNFRASVKM